MHMTHKRMYTHTACRMMHTYAHAHTYADSSHKDLQLVWLCVGPIKIIVVPLRINVNLKSVTVEELTERRKVRMPLTISLSCMIILSLSSASKWGLGFRH